jgi:hypothetical protein
MINIYSSLLIIFIHFNHKFLSNYFNGLINEMISLNSFQLDRASKIGSNIFVQKNWYTFSCVISKCLSLYPVCGVICIHYDILIIGIPCWFDWSHEIKSPLHEGSKVITSLEWLF